MKKTITLSRREIKKVNNNIEDSIFHTFEDGVFVEITAIAPEKLLILWSPCESTEIQISSCVGAHTLVIDGKEYILEVKTKTLF